MGCDTAMEDIYNMTDKQFIDWAEKVLGVKFGFWQKLKLLLEFKWDKIKRLFKRK